MPVPGATQRIALLRAAVRRRPGTVPGSKCATVPGLRRITTLRFVLHRARDTHFALQELGR